MKIFYNFIALFCLLIAPILTFGQSTDSFTTPGADTWTCPVGVTSATVTVYGGGGGGGGVNATSDGAGGGGGGGCSQQTFVVVPGNTYNLYVGAGGAGGVGQNDGGDGEQSWFIDNTTLMANGGSGGLQRTATGGLGGAGAVAGIGTTTFTGGAGRKGNDAANGRGGAGGGGAGTTANGGGGPTTTYGTAAGAGGATGGGNGGAGGNGGDGNNGNTIGGGGSGAGDGTPQTGGDGARGQVNITYTLPPPANDDCANAIPLACGLFEFAGTTEGTTNQAHGTGCTISNYGVWYSFVGDGNTNVIFADPDDSWDLEMAVTTGTCASMTAIGCYDAGLSGEAEGVSIATTLGVTYYVYVAYWSSAGTASDVGPFTISRACNDNTTCATAETLPCDTTLTGSTIGGTSILDGTGCTIGNIGAWYTFIGDGQVTTIQAINYTSYDFEMAIESGACGAFTNVTCQDAGLATETYTFTAALGVKYSIYIADWASLGTNTGMFTIQRTCGNPCGNPQTNDYCSNPATLFQGGAGWSSSTTNTYTPDYPTDMESEFCGSIENNSWYEFTAQSTSETFDFNNISNCSAGIQAEVYSVTRDGSGCCTGLTSVSNCESPGNSSDFTLTATGLTINDTYVLVVDGFAGANCDFTVDNWTASGILPVELLSFEGFREANATRLLWSTETEINNDYFLVQKSSNGKDFINIGTVKGNGTTNNTQHYEYYDNSVSARVNYYRLQQFDFDGKYEYSKMIVVINDAATIDFSVYPNPANDILNIAFSDIDQAAYSVKIISMVGQQVGAELIKNTTGKGQIASFSGLPAGFYSVQVYNANGELVDANRVVKQ